MKKQRSKKRSPRRKQHKIVRGLVEAIQHAADRAATGPILPSAEAMGLAEMVLDRATRKKDKGEVTQIVVAEMLDSALRTRRAVAEQGGIKKGQEEARAQFERQIVDGVMARIAGYANHSKRMGTIALAFHETQILFEVLRKAGYGPQPEVQRHVWRLHNAGDGRIEASHEPV